MACMIQELDDMQTIRSPVSVENLFMKIGVSNDTNPLMFTTVVRRWTFGRGVGSAESMTSLVMRCCMRSAIRRCRSA